MKKTEIVKLMAVISVAFKDFEASEELTEIWYEAIGHYPYNVAMAAVKELTQTAVWTPKLAHVVGKITEMLTPSEELILPGEAWEMARKAVSEIYKNNNSDVFKKLPEDIRKAALSIGTYEIRTSTRPEETQRNFEKTYEIFLNRKKQDRLIAPKLREEIAKIKTLANCETLKLN